MLFSHALSVSWFGSCEMSYTVIKDLHIQQGHPILNAPFLCTFWGKGVGYPWVTPHGSHKGSQKVNLWKHRMVEVWRVDGRSAGPSSLLKKVTRSPELDIVLQVWLYQC